MCAGTYELSLAAPVDQQHKPLIPVLRDAKLISMHGDKMLFSGIEQIDDGGAMYGQQWSVRILSA